MFEPNDSGLLLITQKVGNIYQGKWRKLIDSDLGSGSTGLGTKYLADDMTWKTVSGGGSGIFLDFGHRFSTNPGSFISLGNRFS